MKKLEARNILGTELEVCSLEPLTGFYRSGCCETDQYDQGSHTVCAVMNAEFLEFSRLKGNDLITPLPDLGFPGLKPGDRWCLCALRWQEALEAGVAPRVAVLATHQAALEVLDLEDLKRYAIDLV